MDDEARMSWLSGRPQRVLNLRPPPGFSGNMEYYAQWSVMDDQIMLALPAKEHATCPSLIYLADINASLSRDDNVVELKQVTELPFLASRVRLLSNRAGFITAEFRERSIPITPSEQNKGRYFHQHENFEYGHNHDAIAIPGSSAHNDVVVHHHQRGNRFTAADVGLLTGEIPSEAQPTPWYFTDRDLFKDFFHVFSDKVNARTLTGSIFDRLPSLVGNRLLVREDIEEYEHDEDNYHGYKASHSSFGTFQVLYLYDFDQGRCKALRQLSPQSERQDLETRLKERNPDANVTVTSRMFYTSIEEEDDREKDTSPEWEAHIRERWEIRWAREKGEAKFPTLEFDDPPEGRDDPRMLFTRSMICLPKIRDGEALAMTTSAIIELPAPNADGYVHYFGTE
ncbi:hypothetical protein TrVFT333_003947 [Trichoderma virens FT-333]|nr:hypothetical protein TrVFT333_003947 [Trichoderma virens FT-333]